MTSVVDVMNEFRRVLRKWMEDTTNLEVVFADRSTPRPDAPYIAFKILTGLNKIGALDEIVREKLIDVGPPEVFESLKVKGSRQFTVSITCVGKASEDEDDEDWVRGMDIASQLQNSLDLPSVHEVFRAANLSVVVDNAITNADEFLETDVEPRAVYDIIFSTMLVTEDDAGRIETVKFQGDFDTNQDGNNNLSTGEVEVTN